MEEKKSWFLSKTVIGGLSAMVIGVGSLVGIDLGAESGVDMEAVLTAAATAIAGLITVYGRVTASQKIG